MDQILDIHSSSIVATHYSQGDAFYVLIQWVGIAEGDSKTRVKASFKVGGAPES